MTFARALIKKERYKNMEEKVPSSISFDYNGKHYCLEYTRATVQLMERAGFCPNDIDQKPALRLEQMWAGAFLKNHQNVPDRVISELFGKMGDRKKLFSLLNDMISETYNSLVEESEADEGDQGNVVSWTAM